MASYDLLSHSGVRIAAAVVNFGLAGVSIVYLRLGARDMRWSRSAGRLVTRDPAPELFWSKMGFFLFAALVTCSIGIALLFLKHLRHG